MHCIWSKHCGLFLLTCTKRMTLSNDRSFGLYYWIRCHFHQILCMRYKVYMFNWQRILPMIPYSLWFQSYWALNRAAHAVRCCLVCFLTAFTSLSLHNFLVGPVPRQSLLSTYLVLICSCSCLRMMLCCFPQRTRVYANCLRFFLLFAWLKG